MQAREIIFEICNESINTAINKLQVPLQTVNFKHLVEYVVEFYELSEEVIAYLAIYLKDT